MKKYCQGFLTGVLFCVILWVMLFLFCGCTNTRATVGDATIDTGHLFQDKKIKRVTIIDPNGYTIIIDGYTSETAEVVDSAIRAALGARVKGVINE